MTTDDFQGKGYFKMSKLYALALTGLLAMTAAPSFAAETASIATPDNVASAPITANINLEHRTIEILDHWLDDYVNKQQALSTTDIDKIFAPNAQIILNGKVLAAGSKQVLKHYQEIILLYKHLNMHAHHILVSNPYTAAKLDVSYKTKQGKKVKFSEVIFLKFDGQGKVLWFNISSKENLKKPQEKIKP